MHICIVAATSLELEPLLIKSPPSSDILITGTGSHNTIYHLMKKIQSVKPSLFIQAGIAGAFDHTVPLGQPVLVQQDRFADLGVLENNTWKDVFDLRLDNPDTPPYKNGWLHNPHDELLNILPLPGVPSITINEITTDPARILQIAEKYNPAIESMEGAAFHYVCLQEGIPFIQLRTISNYVGERDKRNWKMELAIRNLCAQLEELIQRSNILPASDNF